MYDSTACSLCRIPAPSLGLCSSANFVQMALAALVLSLLPAGTAGTYCAALMRAKQMPAKCGLQQVYAGVCTYLSPAALHADWLRKLTRTAFNVQGRHTWVDANCRPTESPAHLVQEPQHPHQCPCWVPMKHPPWADEVAMHFYRVVEALAESVLGLFRLIQLHLHAGKRHGHIRR